MNPAPTHSGEMSHEVSPVAKHPTGVDSASATTIRDPASRRTRAIFEQLSASSMGLEFGLCVIIGLLIGRWIDDQTGYSPLFMIVMLCFGFAAGIKGIVRGIKRQDAIAARDAAEARGAAK